MEQKDIEKHRKELMRLAQEAETNKSLQYDSASEEHRKLMDIYKLNSPVGKAVYNSFSDEDLSDYIRQRAAKLNHPPARREVYWIMEIYIKRRFLNWPKALKAAVMSSHAGSGGYTYEKLKEREQGCLYALEQVRKKGEELKRPPHISEVKEYMPALSGIYDTWEQVLVAAGINNEWKKKHMLFKVEDFTEEERKMLKTIKEKATELGRAPLRKEIDSEIRFALKEKCRTWRNTLYQIGLRPIEKKHAFGQTYLNKRKSSEKQHSESLYEGVFKILNLTDEDKQRLDILENIIKDLGRAPIREELPEDVYKNLMELCGSYRNMLYQAGAEPLEKDEALKIRHKLKNKTQT